MVRLVPIEKHIIQVVLLVNMHYFLMWPGWVRGNSEGPLVPIEKDVILMVLLVNIYGFKAT